MANHCQHLNFFLRWEQQCSIFCLPACIDWDTGHFRCLYKCASFLYVGCWPRWVSGNCWRGKQCFLCGWFRQIRQHCWQHHISGLSNYHPTTTTWVNISLLLVLLHLLLLIHISSSSSCFAYTFLIYDLFEKKKKKEFFSSLFDVVGNTSFYAKMDLAKFGLPNLTQ